MQKVNFIYITEIQSKNQIKTSENNSYQFFQIGSIEKTKYKILNNSHRIDGKCSLFLINFSSDDRMHATITINIIE